MRVYRRYFENGIEKIEQIEFDYAELFGVTPAENGLIEEVAAIVGDLDILLTDRKDLYNE